MCSFQFAFSISRCNLRSFFSIAFARTRRSVVWIKYSSPSSYRTFWLSSTSFINFISAPIGSRARAGQCQCTSVANALDNAETVKQLCKVIREFNKAQLKCQPTTPRNRKLFSFFIIRSRYQVTQFPSRKRDKLRWTYIYVRNSFLVATLSAE